MYDSMERLSGEDALFIYLTTEDEYPNYRKIEKKKRDQLVMPEDWPRYMGALKLDYLEKKSQDQMKAADE